MALSSAFVRVQGERAGLAVSGRYAAFLARRVEAIFVVYAVQPGFSTGEFEQGAAKTTPCADQD
jgi:hypothetical protein